MTVTLGMWAHVRGCNHLQKYDKWNSIADFDRGRWIGIVVLHLTSVCYPYPSFVILIKYQSLLLMTIICRGFEKLASENTLLTISRSDKCPLNGDYQVLLWSSHFEHSPETNREICSRWMNHFNAVSAHHFLRIPIQIKLHPNWKYRHSQTSCRRSFGIRPWDGTWLSLSGIFQYNYNLGWILTENSQRWFFRTYWEMMSKKFQSRKKVWRSKFHSLFYSIPWIRFLWSPIFRDV